MAEQRLGRNLTDLLSSSSFNLSEELTGSKESKEGELCKLPIGVLQRGQYQPRRDMDVAKLEELANSIRSQGILHQ